MVGHTYNVGLYSGVAMRRKAKNSISLEYNVVRIKYLIPDIPTELEESVNLAAIVSCRSNTQNIYHDTF